MDDLYQIGQTVYTDTDDEATVIKQYADGSYDLRLHKNGDIRNRHHKSLRKELGFDGSDTGERDMTRGKCPECKRLKARNATDAANGDCDKWYAINDAEAKKECEEVAETNWLKQMEYDSYTTY